MGDSQHTQNIQVNKVIGENEKCVECWWEGGAGQRGIKGRKNGTTVIS